MDVHEHKTHRADAVTKFDPTTKEWVDITPVPPMPIRREGMDTPTPVEPMEEGQYYRLDYDEDTTPSMWAVIKQTPRILWGIVQLWIGVTMTKTQRIAAGITSILVGAAAIFGLDLEPEVAGAITSVVALIVGLLIPTGEAK